MCPGSAWNALESVGLGFTGYQPKLQRDDRAETLI
jgi:hypothetical protein